MKVLVLLAAVACVYGISNDASNILGLAVGATEDVNCKACQDIVKGLVILLNSNKTQTSIENFLEDKVCPMLGLIRSECQQYVKSYAPLVFQLLATELESLNLCNRFGICSAQQQVLKQPVDVSPMFHIVDSTAVNKDKSFASCMICKYVLKKLYEDLGQDATQAQIAAYLDKGCTIIPRNFRSECVKMINKFTPTIVKLVLKKITPEKICKEIRLCSATTQTDNKHVQQQVLKQLVDVSPMFHIVDSTAVNKDKSFASCMICKYVLKKLYEDLGQDATQAKIEAYLDKVCTIIPSNFRSECVKLINEFTPTIVKLVLKKITPEKICKEIRLCSATTQTYNKLGNLFYISSRN